MAQEDVLTYAQLCSQILQKPCFAGPYGTAWQTTMGSAMDVELDRLYYAKEVQWPEYTPTDALYYLASERGLERVNLVGTGGTLEDETLHRLRLKHTWPIWQHAGSQYGHEEALSWTGLGVVEVLRRVDFSTPPPVGSEYVQLFAREVWSQFDILVRQPSTVTPLVWGGGWKYGDGSTYGTSLTVSDVQLLRRLIRDHKSAHDTGTYLYFAFGSGALWGTFRYGDGTVYGGDASVAAIVVGEKSWETRGYL